MPKPIEDRRVAARCAVAEVKLFRMKRRTTGELVSLLVGNVEDVVGVEI